MMDSQLKKGILEICILNRIAKAPVYGYPLMKQVAEHFPDVSESTVYAILRRLAASGYTEVFFGAESGGPERKYYRITGEGAAYLETGLHEWESLQQTVRNMLNAETE
jgi:PadR family transcriptional regulator PadR